MGETGHLSGIWYQLDTIFISTIMRLGYILTTIYGIVNNLQTIYCHTWAFSQMGFDRDQAK